MTRLLSRFRLAYQISVIGAISIVGLLTIAFVYVQANALQANHQQLRARAVAAQHLVGTIRIEMLQAHGHETDFVQQRKSTDQSDHAAPMAEVDRDLQKLAAMPHAADTAAQIAQVEAGVARYVRAFGALAKRDDAADAATLSGTYAELDPALAGLAKTFDAALEAARLKTDETDRVTYATIMGGIGSITMAVLAIAWLIGRAISRPIVRMADAMHRLADGDLEVEVAGVERKDEVGTLAQALQVFKENAKEARALEVERDRQRAEQQRVAERLTELTRQFDGKVTTALGVLSSASTELQATANSMSSTAEETSRQSTAIAAAAEETSANVQTVASASEELSASITEIGRHVSQSTAIATQAVEQATATKQVVNGLADSAQSIGQVVQLITDIASQTNLLALNATIEAARAGESGKGFAVVAAEVKNLANQTTRATDDIAQKIADIQGATGAAVEAIETVGGVIGEINRIATAIAAAVEQQSAATLEISRNVQQAANGTNEVAGNINGLSQAAGSTGAAATQVLGSAGQLSRQAEQLRAEVDQFLADVKAA